MFYIIYIVVIFAAGLPHPNPSASVPQWLHVYSRFGQPSTKTLQSTLRAKAKSEAAARFYNQAVAEVQRRNPHVRLVSVCDREGDFYELLEIALRDPQGPGLLVRAKNDRQLQGEQERLFETVMAQPVAGHMEVCDGDAVAAASQAAPADTDGAGGAGFSPLYGSEQTELSFRTRLSLTLLGELAKLGRPVTLRDVEAALLTDRAYLPALIAPEIRTTCRQYAGKPLNLGGKRRVSLDAPCSVLAKSDLGSSLHSPGAPLWRELAGLLDPAQAFVVPFDPADPVNTPRQLHSGKAAAELLARAAANLEAAGRRLDATLGEMQFVKRQGGSGEQRIAWPGGDDLSGGFNTFSGGKNNYVVGSSNEQEAADVVTGEPLASGLAKSGYPINFGSSWMLVVGFGSQGPVARGLMTYSQSSVAGSPHHLDQTQRYADGAGLRPVPFTETEVSAATRREKTIRPRHWLY